MDITSSNWYAGAATKIFEDFAEAAGHGVEEALYTLLAINIESGLCFGA